MILVDTSVWVAFFRPTNSFHSELLESALKAKLVLIGDLIAAEVLQGIKGRREEKIITTAILALPLRELCGLKVATQAAANYRLLRSRGLTVRGTIDVIIATWCIENDIELLHNDRDFAVMEAELGMPCYKGS